ncbi:hypothetical protein Adt_20788 [Abeliophyllum distichum]|uniref:Uncharacterized protein n=1 Tax=Abeliophyllum distichum TaxID=126358 RepID=A0ABD1SXH8_9LAMI
MSHGGDGASDPPYQLPCRLVSACESGQREEATSFDNVKHTTQPIENNTKYFTRLVGNQVKFTVLPCYPSWTEVPEEQRARLRGIIEDKLVELRETQQTQVTSSDVSVDEHAIAKEAPEGISHQFSGDPQNDDPWFAMYEAQLRQMQRDIQRLKDSIPGVVLESDEDEDKGLGDL